MAIITEIFDENHVRRYSDSGVMILNSRDGHEYAVAEDWTDEWFNERGLTPPTYTETETEIPKKL